MDEPRNHWLSERQQHMIPCILSVNLYMFPEKAKLKRQKANQYVPDLQVRPTEDFPEDSGALSNSRERCQPCLTRSVRRDSRHENTTAQVMQSSLPVITISSLPAPDHQNQEGRLSLAKGTASAKLEQNFGMLQRERVHGSWLLRPQISQPRFPCRD